MANTALIDILREQAYEMYKRNWLRRVPVKEQQQVVKDYLKEIIDYAESYPDDEDVTTLDEYIQETGYSNGLYVCFDEFLQTEYKLGSCIRIIIDDDELFEKYKQLDPEFATED